MKPLIIPILILICTISLTSRSTDRSFPKAAADRDEAAALFQRLRNDNLQPLDAGQSLNLVTQALANADTDINRAALLRGMKAELEGHRQLDRRIGSDLRRPSRHPTGAEATSRSFRPRT